MELVLLQDIQNSFASNWARIANTSGVKEIQIGDRFREQGFGQGAEELEVAGIGISPIGGASRLFFHRAAHNTKPEVHRLGAVLEQVGIAVQALDLYLKEIETTKTNGSASAPAPAEGTDEPLVPLKRKRGRPIGSRNKAQTALPEEVSIPGFD